MLRYVLGLRCGHITILIRYISTLTMLFYQPQIIDTTKNTWNQTI